MFCFFPFTRWVAFSLFPRSHPFSLYIFIFISISIFYLLPFIASLYACHDAPLLHWHNCADPYIFFTSFHPHTHELLLLFDDFYAVFVTCRFCVLARRSRIQVVQPRDCFRASWCIYTDIYMYTRKISQSLSTGGWAWVSCQLLYSQYYNIINKIQTNIYRGCSFYMEGREGWERDRINKVGQDVTETWVSLPVPVASPKCLSVCLPLYLGQPVRAFLCSDIMAMGDVHQARVFVFSFRYTHLSYHIKHVHV